MKTSAETDKIDSALAKAQAEMTNPTQDAKNDHFRNKYATLASVRNAVIPVLAKHGISCTQELVSGVNQVGCATRLAHAGQWIEFEPLMLPAGKNDAQGYGSACTYARRYSLQAVAGVFGDADDDGNEASKPEKKDKPVLAKATANPVTPTAGAKDRVRPDRLEHVQAIANRVMDFYLQDCITDAAMVVDECDLDADETTYFWTLLDTGPKNKIKAEGRRLTQEAAVRAMKEREAQTETV